MRAVWHLCSWSSYSRWDEEEANLSPVRLFQSISFPRVAERWVDAILTKIWLIRFLKLAVLVCRTTIRRFWQAWRCQMFRRIWAQYQLQIIIMMSFLSLDTSVAVGTRLVSWWDRRIWVQATTIFSAQIQSILWRLRSSFSTVYMRYMTDLAFSFLARLELINIDPTLHCESNRKFWFLACNKVRQCGVAAWLWLSWVKCSTFQALRYYRSHSILHASFWFCSFEVLYLAQL